MPNNVGYITAGTLFYAGDFEPNNYTTILKVYYSNDEGYTWNYYTTLAQGGGEGSGVWEPEFVIGGDGALVAYWSDETDNGNHSQKLREARNYGANGTNGWQDAQDVVASSVQADRPGMAVVSRTPSGYFMTFEHCGPADCEVHYKTSPDGWNWGSASDVGTRVQTADGRYFKHTPYNIWSPNPNGSGGALIVVGQILLDSNGNITSGNGGTLLANTNSDGSGSFYSITSPVNVPDANASVCPNYSSPLLQSSDGYYLLGLATDNSNGKCVAYYNTEELW